MPCCPRTSAWQQTLPAATEDGESPARSCTTRPGPLCSCRGTAAIQGPAAPSGQGWMAQPREMGLSLLLTAQRAQSGLPNGSDRERMPQRLNTGSFSSLDHTQMDQERNRSSFSHFPRVSAPGIHPVPTPSTMRSPSRAPSHSEVTAPITLAAPFISPF